MIDFHTHTFLSDGALSPAEHVRRAYVAGYKVLGITDHVDFSNIEFVFEGLKRCAEETKGSGWDIEVIPGVEITHVPANKIEKIVNLARNLKIPLIIVHGESPVEPVEPGTNRAAIEAGVDILAHPGLIKDEDVIRAKELGVYLEITAKRGHGMANGHVAKLSDLYGCKTILSSDAHIHTEFLSENTARTVLKGSGMSDAQYYAVSLNLSELYEKIKLKF